MKRQDGRKRQARKDKEKVGTDRRAIIICIMLYQTVSPRVPPPYCFGAEAPKRRPTTLLNTNVRQKKKDGTRQRRRDDDYESDKNENGERKSHGLTRRLKRTDRDLEVTDSMTDREGRKTDGETGRTRTVEQASEDWLGVARTDRTVEEDGYDYETNSEILKIRTGTDELISKNWQGRTG